MTAMLRGSSLLSRAVRLEGEQLCRKHARFKVARITANDLGNPLLDSVNAGETIGRLSAA